MKNSDKIIEDCGCVVTRYFVPKFSTKLKLCKQHRDARKNRKPYAEGVNLGKGLCPLCHGYDEVCRETACWCEVSNRWTVLEQERNAVMRVLSISLANYKRKLDECEETVLRIKKRRGKE